MIWLYTGTPGSGKSVHVAKDIYWKLRKPEWVFANFEINRDFFWDKKHKKNSQKGIFIERPNWKLNARWLIDFAKAYFSKDTKGRIIEGQALLVIDECQLIFNAREWQANDRMEWTSFFTQHRKLGYNIILITQFDRLIDRQIRSLVEYEVKHRKLNNYKLLGKICGLLLGGTAFMSITYWYGARERISSEMFAGKKYYEFYDSYKMFNEEKNPKAVKG